MELVANIFSSLLAIGKEQEHEIGVHARLPKDICLYCERRIRISLVVCSEWTGICSRHQEAVANRNLSLRCPLRLTPR